MGLAGLAEFAEKHQAATAADQAAGGVVQTSALLASMAQVATVESTALPDGEATDAAADSVSVAPQLDTEMAEAAAPSNGAQLAQPAQPMQPMHMAQPVHMAQPMQPVTAAAVGTVAEEVSL